MIVRLYSNQVAFEDIEFNGGLNVVLVKFAWRKIGIRTLTTLVRAHCASCSISAC